jgi:hypothetical protein
MGAQVSPEQAFGPKFNLDKVETAEPIDTPKATGDVVLDTVLRWNQIAIDASGLDHAPPASGEDRVFGEQLGPARASRAIAIVQVAVFEALNAIERKNRSYLKMGRVSKYANQQLAIATAAHHTLVELFPSQKEEFDAQYLIDLRNTKKDFKGYASGRYAGEVAAALILARRSNDGSEHSEPLMDIDYLPAQDAGVWRQDPISLVPIALGAKWGQVKPFVMKAGDQFRAPPPPAMSSDEYTIAYKEAYALGGDGVNTPTERTEEQTFIGIYWAYDGTPSLCAPPRLYNQLMKHIADQMGSDGRDTARLLAVANVALADAAITIWDSKYFYKYWRPVTAIREADEGMGPTGSGDGNQHTMADQTFTPLGAPASNLSGPNFTPPFPTYPSGHAGFGGALFQVLRRFYGTNDIAFTFVSDEYNGLTYDNLGKLRPLKPRSFSSLSEAEEENGRSRIYLGIHWYFDSSEGIKQGNRVGDYVVDRLYLPILSEP